MMAIKCPKCRHENPDGTAFCGQCGASLKEDEGFSKTKTFVTPSETLQKGTILSGRYTIIEELGRGGMGVVYKAEDTKLKRTVALKFLPSDLIHIPEVKTRFMREAQAAAALDHPNICTVHEFDEADAKPFFSMAYIQGQSLKKMIESGPLDLEEALKISMQVAEGLQQAHKKGIVHRDIKSGNIMVTDRGQAKIMDFGLARKTEGTLLTKEGSTMGTVAYMSPEQAQGEKVDHRTDIWSFGVVLYEMLTGQLPFKGEHEQAVVYSILKEKPKPITDIKSDIPPSIEQVVNKALEKDPNKRYQQIDELIDDLKSISAGIVPEEIRARIKKEKLRKRKRAFLYGGAAALVTAAVVMVLLIFTGPAEAIDSIAVLPLENLTGNPDQDYFVDGVTDELIGQLGQISGLRRVISRTSVMRYKDTDKSLPEIARELNVDALVEGTVYQVGENVSIKLQLFDALPEERSLWTQRYDRPISDVLMMYGEMAGAIAENIQVKLTEDETSRFAGVRQVNFEIYDAHLKARSYWEEGGESLYKGLEILNSAVEKNPDWAPLYAGLAETWMWIQQDGFEPTSVTAPKIYENLNKAMELDPNLSEANRLSGMIAQLVEWNWEKSEKAFLKALAINPNGALTRMFYAQLLLILHRSDEALAQRELAMSLDPLGPMMKLMNLGTLVQAGDYETSLSLAEELAADDPDNFNFNQMIEIAAYRLKKYDKVIKAVRYALPFPMEEETFKEIVRIYRESGIVVAYKEIMKHLEKFAENNYVGFQGMALRYIIANQPDKAMDWVEKGFEMHEPEMTYITTPAQYFDRLFGNPRFIAICEKMNLKLPK
jgi:TolB-like protein/tetratricopeptide (TPR) repeat protein/predicted Ser/Thr protein kinase